MAKDKSEPAFARPASPIEFTDWAQPGMSVRDYFAAKSLQGYRASGNTSESDLISKLAYHDADSMLVRREK